MRIEDMKRRKRELGYTARQIADLSRQVYEAGCGGMEQMEEGATAATQTEAAP